MGCPEVGANPTRPRHCERIGSRRIPLPRHDHRVVPGKVAEVTSSQETYSALAHGNSSREECGRIEREHRPTPFPSRKGRGFLLGWMARIAPLLITAGLVSAVGPVVLHAQIIVEDDLGRSVVFAKSPCRIVSLIPAATEIVFALGAESCLVGRSIYDDHPAGVESIPEVGQAIGADVERVLAQRPDLVLLIAGSDNARSVEQFNRLGIASLVFRLNRISGLGATIRRLGVVLNRERAADSLWAGIEAELDSVRRRTAGLAPPTVYYDIAYPPPITIGAGSYLDTLIVIAGGHNAFHDVSAPSPSVTLEAIVLRDPDVIVYPVSRVWGGAADPGRRPLWRGLRAITTGNVRQVDADLLHRLGPRVGEAARHLSEILHPDLAGERP